MILENIIDMYYIHVNRNTIDSNRKHGKNDPVIKFQKGKYGKATYAHRVKIKDGEVLYSAHEPILPCGARLVIISEERPEVLE